MKDIKGIINTILNLIGAIVKQKVLKFRLWVVEKQQHNTSSKNTKYTPRLPYGRDEVEDYWG